MTTPDLPHLVDRWVEGFARSRQVPYARYADLIEVEVEDGGRRLELVLTEPTRELLEATAVRVAGTADVWLTAFSVTPWGHATPDGLRLLRSEEVLMIRSLGLTGTSGDGVKLEEHGHRLHAAVRDGDAVAAEGWVAVVGEHATFDRIMTAPQHRRQGLAGRVLQSLEEWAVEQGARTGLLAASADGRALYSGLGWDVAAAMTTLGGLDAELPAASE